MTVKTAHQLSQWFTAAVEIYIEIDLAAKPRWDEIFEIKVNVELNTLHMD